MSEEKTDEYRMERISRLLKELSYEIAAGLGQRNIPENIGYTQVFPSVDRNYDGNVVMEFRLKPMKRYDMMVRDIGSDLVNGLRVIDGGKKS